MFPRIRFPGFSGIVLAALWLSCSVACTKESPGVPTDEEAAPPQPDPGRTGTPQTGSSRAEGPSLPGTPRGEDATRPLVAPPESAARSHAGAFHVKLEWIAGPGTGENNGVRLVFGDASGYLPTAVSAVAIEPWMAVHGHGSSNLRLKVTQEREAPHIHRVTGLNFIMSGPWELRITATVSGTTDNATVGVEVP